MAHRQLVWKAVRIVVRESPLIGVRCDRRSSNCDTSWSGRSLFREAASAQVGSRKVRAGSLARLAKPAGTGLMERAERWRGGRATRSSATPGCSHATRHVHGLGLVERGAIAAGAGASSPPVLRRSFRFLSCAPEGDDRLRRPARHARPDRLPYPPRLRRRPRARVGDAAAGRDLRGDRARRRRHPFDGARRRARRARTRLSKRRCRASTR